jgi:hypothetical protein
MGTFTDLHLLLRLFRVVAGQFRRLRLFLLLFRLLVCLALSMGMFTASRLLASHLRLLLLLCRRVPRFL